MNATLLNILKMRSSLFDSATLQNEGLQLLSGLKDSTDQPLVGSLLDGVGNAISYSFDSEGVVSITQDVKDGEQVDISLFEGQISDWSQLIDNVMTGEEGGVLTEGSTNILSFLQDSSRGQQSNLLLSAALDKFSTNSRCNSQDLITLVDSFGVQSADKTQLKQAIAAASDSEGKISNYSFLQIVQNIANNAKDRLGVGKISMDTTSIFYLTNFLSTAWSTIISVIGTIVGTLLTMVNQILGLIVTAITWIVSTIFGAVQKAVPSKIVVKDPLSSTDWFDGPIAANFINLEGDFVVDKLSSDEVRLYSDGAVDHCIWLGEDNKIAINRFLGCGLKLSAAANYLANILTYTVERSGSDYIYHMSCPTAHYWVLPPHWPSECLLTVDEQLEVLNKSTDDLNEYITSCYYLSQGLLVAYFFYMHKYMNPMPTIDIQVKNAWVSRESIYDMSVYATQNGKGFMSHLLKYLYWAETRDSNNLINAGDTSLTLEAMDAVKLANVVLTDPELIWNVELNSENVYHEDEGAFFVGEFTTLTCATDDVARFIKRDDDYWGYPAFTAILDLVETNLSTIPSDRMFRYAAYDTQDLIKAMIIIGSIVTIALVAGSIIVKQIKKFSYRRQLERKQELLNLSSNYADNPSAENFNALYKAQRSYNFKAKIFGWDTYDAANQWFDAPEEPGNDGGMKIQGANVSLDDIVKLIR